MLTHLAHFRSLGLPTFLRPREPFGSVGKHFDLTRKSAVATTQLPENLTWVNPSDVSGWLPLEVGE